MEINENNLIPVTLSDLKAGQRVEKRTAADGSVFYVVHGVGSFVSGGKVFVEAQTTFTDDTSTTATIRMKANRVYKFTQPLTRLVIESVENSVLESEILFTAGAGIRVTTSTAIGDVAMPVFTEGKSYFLSVKHGIIVGAEYTPGVEA